MIEVTVTMTALLWKCLRKTLPSLGSPKPFIMLPWWCWLFHRGLCALAAIFRVRVYWQTSGAVGKN